MGYWNPAANHREIAQTVSDSKPTGSSLLSRQELLEVLDRVVTYEHYYRSVYGHYTKFLGRVGVWIPRNVQDAYEIRVVEASADRLLVTAVSEHGGRTSDMASIDQDFRLRSNFGFPGVRPDYLKIHAHKHLRALRQTSRGNTVSEVGLFQGYFQYSTDRDSAGKRVLRADGVKAPVMGMRLELDESEIDWTSSEETALGGGLPGTSVAHASHSEKGNLSQDLVLPASPPSHAGMTTLEEAYLAQRIFQGEMGRFARTWEELMMVADFRFEDQDLYGPAEVPFGDSSPIRDLDVAPLRSPASVASGQGLEIEPL